MHTPMFFEDKKLYRNFIQQKNVLAYISSFNS